MFRIFTSLLVVATLLCPSVIKAAAIPGLYGTGLDDSYNILTLGEMDTHYYVLETDSEAKAMPSNWPWLSNSNSSQWIWENTNGQPTHVTRTFRTTFNLSGLDSSTAQVSGTWATDNDGLDILINGLSTFNTSASFSNYSNFSVDSGFRQGLNTLDFVVHDFGAIAGFRVDTIVGTASSLGPEPSTIVEINPTGTYLKPMDPLDVPVQVTDSKIVDMATSLSFPVVAGDYLRLQTTGDFDYATADDGDNTGGPFGNGTLADVWGVFSSSDTLLTKTEANRVPDALAPGMSDFTYAEVESNGIIPNIAGDFLIPSEMGDKPDGVIVRVPEGATHLFLGAADDVWSDNTDLDEDFGVRITRLNPDRFVGDYDFDGETSGSDFLQWQRQFDQTGLDLTADGNLDSTVNAADLAIWEQNYGIATESQATNQAVPEPTSLALLSLAVGMILSRHSRLRGKLYVSQIQSE